MEHSPSWSQSAWTDARQVFNEICSLEFVDELASGSLSQERFSYYYSQDIHYLRGYARVLAHMASQLVRADDFRSFLGSAADVLNIADALYADGTIHEFDTKCSKATKAYLDFLRSMERESAAVECAAILPCFLVYQKIGEYIITIARLDGNPYRDWILTYSDPAFDQGSRRVMEIADRLANEADEATRRRMTEVFIECCRCIKRFWSID